jgi:Predicted membrane protein (DUF2142)
MTSDATVISDPGARRAKLALAAGLALVAIAIGAVLSRSPLVVAGTNSVPTPNTTGFIRAGKRLCVNGGTVPRNTVAIRVPLEANVGPEVSVSVSAGSRVLTTGTRAAGWGDATAVAVPVKRTAHPIGDASVCISVGPVSPFLLVAATVVTSTSPTGQEVSAESLHLEYLRSSQTSWWSLVPSIVRHMSFGHAAPGTWVVFFVLALMLAVAFLASWLAVGKAATWRRSRVAPSVQTQATRSKPTLRAWAALGRIPLTAWICALVACMNAVCWSILTPPFQIPDEQSHFAYTQQLAEAHRLPTSNAFGYSPEEELALNDLHQREVRRQPQNHTISTQAEQQQLQEALAQRPGRRGTGGVGGSESDPPLYYALEIIPYELGSPGTILDQLELMRLESALMAGLTALFAFLFIREALPRVPWAWTVGGLGVALAPLLGFMSGAVNPDAMLFAVSAAIFYCLARAFRRGLTRGRAAAIGALTAVGLLTKVNFVGLAPGVILGLVVLAVRAPRSGRRGALCQLGLGAAIAVSPACVYVLVQLLSNRPALGVISETLKVGDGQGSLWGAISYVWQFYLPHLPGMTNVFPGMSVPRQVWFDRSVGLYGWLDTSFPLWANDVALVPAGLIVLLCLRALLASSSALRQRLAELGVYCAIGFGLMVLIALSNYFSPGEFLAFAEPRYLAPMLPLLGAVLVLAARGAGRRWGPAVGVLIVVLVLAHDVFSQLLVISRYYV